MFFGPVEQGSILSQLSRWGSQLSRRQQPVQPTRLACSFIYMHIHTHTQTHNLEYTSLHHCHTASFSPCGPPPHSPATVQGSNHDWWPVTHMTTHTANEQMHACAVSTRMQTQSLYLIEVSGVSDVCLSSWKWSAGASRCSGCGGGFILQLSTNTPLFYTGALWVLHHCTTTCCRRKIKVTVMNCQSL